MLSLLRKNWILLGIALFTNIHANDVFPFTPPQNFTLNTKYIALHHPVTTQKRKLSVFRVQNRAKRSNFEPVVLLGAGSENSGTPHSGNSVRPSTRRKK